MCVAGLKNHGVTSEEVWAVYKTKAAAINRKRPAFAKFPMLKQWGWGKGGGFYYKRVAS